MHIQSKFFGLFVCLVWLSSIYFVYPFPTQDIQTLKEIHQEYSNKGGSSHVLNEEEVENASLQIWAGWILRVAIYTLGALLGWLYFINKRKQRSILILSILFLISWVIKVTEHHYPAHSTSLDTYFSNWTLLMENSSLYTKYILIHGDIFSPIAHSLIILFISIKYLRDRN